MRSSNALISVLDDIAARPRTYLCVLATKLEDTLKAHASMGERYGAAGEDFDPNLHDALMATTSADVNPRAGRVLTNGYRRGRHVVRAEGAGE